MIFEEERETRSLRKLKRKASECGVRQHFPGYNKVIPDDLD
ncbi:hypothetical protein RchiOBHm_Chr3g0497561 [Rosa chinensis]|uniref:Uncharacterized protein n=1 Tax=Rosa chinensis TaxID=74649 RepID=A0A2P6RHS2_ROSCH|nr:hypothetical protein RchiOBHm_Chr3g0497561 [Rosa chinensis]